MRRFFIFLIAACLFIPLSKAQDDYSTQLKALVKDAAGMIRTKGEAAFNDFRITGSLWRQGETYIFVLDPTGNMLVHPDPELEGKNQINLKDINGKPIVRGLLEAAMTFPDKPEGWYHYEWTVPGGILPRWKSSYVQLVKAPSGNSYVVGSGIYTDRMERDFVVSMVDDAVAQIEKQGESAFYLFRDRASRFIAQDAYVFVIDAEGIELVNPAFPNLERRNLMDLKDVQGKYVVREMFKVVQTSGSGWVDYMWPKPGENVSTVKSAYVRKVDIGDTWLLVGCGVYLADAPKSTVLIQKMTAPELMTLVGDAAKVFEQRGEEAYPDFRVQGSKWFRGDTYFFVWSMEGVRLFHAANPASEQLNVRDLKDVIGRPIGKMILEAGTSTAGEGWIHYMYPEPNSIFPAWKSTFIKRVAFPSGKTYIIGCGVYNIEMNEAFIEDVVNNAADLVAMHGQDAFPQLRDKTGPFLFMDTYVFVDNLEGLELVNGAQPSMEGKNFINMCDARGKFAVREYLEAAVKKGSAWIDYYWYKPGDNTLAKKYTYVRLVKHGTETYVVGAG
ncbi:MAG: hypothetical protein EP344_15460, partial [Bacteroidetes bacterium]